MLEKATLYCYRVQGKPTYTLRLRQATVQALGLSSQEKFKLSLVAEVKVRKGIPILVLAPGNSLELNDILQI